MVLTIGRLQKWFQLNALSEPEISYLFHCLLFRQELSVVIRVIVQNG